MNFIPAKVIFNEKEKAFLSDYIQQWDATGAKRQAISETNEFDICTVRENEELVRGFRFDYEHDDGEDENIQTCYVSFQGLEAFIVNQACSMD